MKKLLTLLVFAFMVSGSAAFAGEPAAAEKDKKAAKDKPAKSDKPADDKAADKAGGEKKK